MAAVSSIFHAIWLRKLLRDVEVSHHEAIRIYIDNKSTTDLAKNSVNHKMRNKHIDIRFRRKYEGKINRNYTCQVL